MESPLLSKVGESLKNYRELKSLSREDVADMLSMTSSGYGKIERGETDVPLSRLEQICNALGITLAQILQFEAQHIYHINNNGLVQGPGNKAENIHYHTDTFKDKYIEVLERENARLRKLLGENE